MSEHSSLLLHAGWILDGSGELLIDDTLYIEDSVILQTGAWEDLSEKYPDTMRLEIVDCAVMPGWVIGCSRLEWALLRYDPKGLWLPWDDQPLPAWWNKITENDRVTGTRFGILDLISHGITRIYDLSLSPSVSENLETSGLEVYSLEVNSDATAPNAERAVYPVLDPSQPRLWWTTALSLGSGKERPLIFDEGTTRALEPSAWGDASGSWAFGLPITPWTVDLLVRTRNLGCSLGGLIGEKGWNSRLLRGLWGGMDVTFPSTRDEPPVPATLTAVRIQSYRVFPEANPVPYLMTRASAADVFMTMVKGDILYLNERFYGSARDIAQACLYGWDVLSSEARRHFQEKRSNGGLA